MFLPPRADPGEDQWDYISSQTTQSSGRTDLFALRNDKLEAATYRLTFQVADYFGKSQRKTFFPQIPVVFQVQADELDQNFHVPITLSEFGFSTYRGV